MRDCAITPAARDIYDRLTAQVKEESKALRKEGDEIYRKKYPELLGKIFRDGFPAWTLSELRKQGLGYFHYQLRDDRPETDLSADPELSVKAQLEKWIESGHLTATPVTYEDFLPVSAAGIFHSNLDDKSGSIDKEDPNQTMFEEALGHPVHDPFALYEAEQQRTIDTVFETLGLEKERADAT